jgi:hypothetical protein
MESMLSAFETRGPQVSAYRMEKYTGIRRKTGTNRHKANCSWENGLMTED